MGDIDKLLTEQEKSIFEHKFSDLKQMKTMIWVLKQIQTMFRCLEKMKTEYATHSPLF